MGLASVEHFLCLNEPLVFRHLQHQAVAYAVLSIIFFQLLFSLVALDSP